MPVLSTGFLTTIRERIRNRRVNMKMYECVHGDFDQDGIGQTIKRGMDGKSCSGGIPAGISDADTKGGC
jgi:hypothetical protein